MPIIEFTCDACSHRYEQLFSFREVQDDMTNVCPVCKAMCHRVLFSSTLEPHFYGDPTGYAKPSPTKRFSYKTVTEREGNKWSAG